MSNVSRLRILTNKSGSLPLYVNFGLENMRA